MNAVSYRMNGSNVENKSSIAAWDLQARSIRPQRPKGTLMMTFG